LVFVVAGSLVLTLGLVALVVAAPLTSTSSWTMPTTFPPAARQKSARSRPPSVAAAADPGDACDPACSEAGTVCIGNECRLEPGAHWDLHVEGLLVRGAPPSALEVCVRATCTRMSAVSPQAGGTWFRALDPPTERFSSEQLNAGQVAVSVRSGATPLASGMGPSGRLVAREKLLRKGLVIKVQSSITEAVLLRMELVD
jgi:hypothetical protein